MTIPHGDHIAAIERLKKMSWKVAHGCVRGSAHVRSGLPNQDAAQCVVLGGDRAVPAVAIAAVSDGHGGARHFRSQIGSALAVSTAIHVLQDFLSKRGPAESIGAHEIQALQQSIVGRWLSAVSADLEDHPLTGEELATLEQGDGSAGRSSVETTPTLAYGATLLVAAATDDLILYLQLGDGEILTVDAAGHTVRPLPEDARLVANQTTSLCQPDAWQEFRAAWFTAPDLPALVLLSTDGYANSFRSDEDFLKIGADYLEIIREQGISTLADELPAILTEASQQGSGDDITLAVLLGDLNRGAAEKNGGPVKPRISTETRSALIEQLKARHSSQHRRLDELSSRLEETRQDNRRLRWVVLLLVLLVAGAGLYFFRGSLHIATPSKPDLKPSGGAEPRIKPEGKPEPIPTPAPLTPKSAKAAVAQWRLTVQHPALQITLAKGATIACDQIAPCEHGDSDTSKLFAEVAFDPKSNQTVLINRSGFAWAAKPGKGKKKDILNNQHIALEGFIENVTFKKGIEGVISPLEDSPSTGSVAPVPAGGDLTTPAAPADPIHPETE
jgi:Protein phosphatase 2C